MLRWRCGLLTILLGLACPLEAQSIFTYAGGGTVDGRPATLAALNTPRGISIDSSGAFGFGDDDGPATAAQLFVPVSVAVDDAGNVYIADRDNFRVRRVDGRTRRIETYAGIGGFGFSGGFLGDAGPATAAKLGKPSGLAVTPDGDLFIADRTANRVRMIFACRDLATPALVSPSDGSSGLPSSPLLVWRATTGAMRYDAYLGTMNPPTSRVATDIETTSFSPSNLQPLTTYYWRVVAKGDPYCEPFRRAESDVSSFTTTSSCDVPGEFGPGES